MSKKKKNIYIYIYNILKWLCRLLSEHNDGSNNCITRKAFGAEIRNSYMDLKKLRKKAEEINYIEIA